MDATSRDGHRPDVRIYLGIGAALFALTVLTVAVSKVHLSRGPALTVGLSIALVKASLVAAIFMHLRGESRLIQRLLLTTAFFAGLLTLPLIDARAVLRRLVGRVPVAEQHPAAPHGQAPGAPHGQGAEG